MAMTQQEFEESLKSPCQTAQIVRLESDAGIKVLMRFPPGERMLIAQSPVPMGKIANPNDFALGIRDNFIARLEERKHPGDSEILNFTNWTSVLAALQALVIEFNNARAKIDPVIADLKAHGTTQ